MMEQPNNKAEMMKTWDLIKVTYLSLYKNVAGLGEKKILIIVGHN